MKRSIIYPIQATIKKPNIQENEIEKNDDDLDV